MKREYAERLLNVHTNKILSDQHIVEQINKSAPSKIQYINIKQKIYHIAHNLQEIPTCERPQCTTPVKWDKQNQRYAKFCSYVCSNSTTAATTLAKRLKTNQQKYGGNAPSCSKTIQKKMEQSNIERYGDDFKQKNAEKSRQAIQRLYGVSNVSQLESTKDKKIQASRKRFGTNHPMQFSDVRERTLATLKEKYNVDNINRINIPQASLHLLNDSNFLMSFHVHQGHPLNHIATLLGVSYKCVYNAMVIHDIPITKTNNPISVGEQEVFDFVKTLCPDAEQSNRTVLRGKELDIFIPELKIAIEYCGLYWHSSAHSRITRNYHKNKLEECNRQGIRLITLFENEWLYSKSIVKKKIQHILSKSSDRVIYARNTHIRQLTNDVAKAFHKKHHIQGMPKVSSISIGAFDEDEECVAVMTFTKRKSYCELVRFSTSCRVVGGFSKMFKYATTTQNIDHDVFVSFVDCRWSTSDVYKQCGWEVDSFLPPDYKYVEGDRLVHKFNYRHKNLPNKLTNYDPTLSEYQNTKNHNVHRVYDCGKIRMKWTSNNHGTKETTKS